MMKRACPKCGTELQDDTVRFCPKCGANCLQQATWYCQKCGTENELTANFCKSCGTSRALPARTEAAAAAPAEPSRWQKLVQHPYFKYGCLILLVMLIGGFGSYYYFMNMNEGHYLTKYAEASRTLEAANTILLNNTKPDVLKPASLEETRKQLQEQKSALDSLAQEFSRQKPFKNYEEPHRAMAELLQKESAVFDQTILVLTKPLDGGTDDVLASIREDAGTIKDLSGKIQVPNASLTSIDLSVLPQQLSSFVESQRKLHARQAAMEHFFSEMDKVIADYDGEKTDFGGMLESSRKDGGMIWADYFKILDKARHSREALKAKVNALRAPAGTEKLPQQFSQVLTESLRYCELMRISANLTFNRYYADGRRKEREAQTLNKQVQDDYADFISNYNADKLHLLNEGQ